MNTINSGSSCQIDGAMRLIVIVSATIYCVVYLGRGFLGSTNSANEDITSSSSNVVESMLAHDVTSTENDSLTRGFDEELFQQTWQDIKANLCPNSLPSHEKYGPTLIDLARNELGLRKMDPLILSQNDDYTHFWTFMPSKGTAYTKQKEDDSHHVKAAHADEVEERGRRSEGGRVRKQVWAGAGAGANPPSMNDRNISTPKVSSFLHMPIWKCANNDIRKNLFQTLPESKPVNIDCSRTGKPGEFECWPKSIGGVENVPNACVVAVVRDPISHFLSGYNEYEVRLNRLEETTLLVKEDDLIATTVNFERFSYGSDSRFEQFVADFLTGHTQMNLTEKNLQHIFSMTGILTGLDTLYQRKLNGYLASINDLEHNYPNFLKETCPHVLPNDAFEPWNVEARIHHTSEADELGFRLAANSVWARGGHTSRALCMIHAMDYACFDKLPVHDFCKHVYSSEPFLKALM